MSAGPDRREVGGRDVVEPPRLALISRGDPLVPYLHSALRERYPVVADVDVELSGVRRAAVAALTVRPTWRAWSESYMKSNLGFRARSRLADAALAAVPGTYDVVLQTHALFANRSPRAVVYVDCTYRQAMLGWPAWTPQRGRARERWLEAETAAYRHAVHLFAFTDLTRRSLIEDYRVDPARVTVVGAGVNVDHLPPRLPPRRTAAPTVLFVGKDFTRKGGDVLLRAFRIARETVPDAVLRIVGTTIDGPVPDGVEVVGLVRDRQLMTELYLQADVFCLPSLFDPAPLVVLEAMAHGLPCVLSHDASHHVRRLVDERDAAYVAPTGDAAGLARGLVRMLTDRDLALRTGATGYAAMSSDFRWSDVVERMAPALEQARDGAPTAGRDQPRPATSRS